MEQKKIKVIKILSHFDLIINYGKKDGASPSDRFSIMDFKDTHIIDPDTKEDLGVMPTKKASVKIKAIYDKFSICTNTERVFSPVSALTNSIARLNVDENQITQVSGSTNPIKIGDIVIKDN